MALFGVLCWAFIFILRQRNDQFKLQAWIIKWLLTELLITWGNPDVLIEYVKNVVSMFRLEIFNANLLWRFRTS